MKTKLAPAIVAAALINLIPIAAVLAQSAQPVMKAAVVYEYGGPEVFKYEDAPRPEPKDDEVLVRVIAAGVNPVDAYVRQGILSKRGFVDVVLNAVRGDTLPPSYGVVKKGGIIVSITGEPDAAECAKHGIRGSGLMAHPDAKVLEELTKLIEANKITPIVSQTFPLMDAAQAHQQIETHHTRGKIVLKVAPERK